MSRTTDAERDALDVRPTRARRCSPGSAPRRRGARGRLRVYLGHGARRRQDLPDARGGPPPASTAARTSSSASSRRTAGRTRRRCSTGLEVVPAAPDRVPRRGRRGDGHRRGHRPPARPSPWSTSWPTRTSRAPRARSAGRTSRSIRDAGIHVVSTLQRPAPRVASPTPSRRSPARRSTSASPTRCSRPPTRSSSST